MEESQKIEIRKHDMKALKILWIILVITTSRFGIAAQETKTFDSTRINSIDITNRSGDVEIGVSAGSTTVSYEKIQFDKSCNFSAKLSGSTLVIRTEDKSLLGKSECQVKVNVNGPKNVAIKLKNDSGDIQVRDTSGSIEYKIGSGKVNIKASVTDLNGNSGSGDVSVVGITGNVGIRLGSGEVKLVYNKCPNQGKIDIITGSGDATVSLPSDSIVSTSFKAGSGKLKSDFVTSSNPNLHILMRTGSGSLIVRRN